MEHEVTEVGTELKREGRGKEGEGARSQKYLEVQKRRGKDGWRRSGMPCPFGCRSSVSLVRLRYYFSGGAKTFSPPHTSLLTGKK